MLVASKLSVVFKSSGSFQGSFPVFLALGEEELWRIISPEYERDRCRELKKLCTMPMVFEDHSNWPFITMIVTSTSFPDFIN